jgi:Flp pilus assembly protein TadG
VIRHTDGRAARRREDGQALVLFALSLTGLLAISGLVVDIGGAWSQARTQQKVADVAALAGATAETNGATRAQIMQAAVLSAVANGFTAAEVQVNIPPTSGKYAPGGSASGALSTNDCSTPAKYPCWVEVAVARAHANTFSRIVGLDSFPVTVRGVSVGGIANMVTNGIAPLMFNYKALTLNGSTPALYCDPQPGKCEPNSSWPLVSGQFAWTTYCSEQADCNVSSDEAKQIIDGGNFQVSVTNEMYLGPHNLGQKSSVCTELLAQFPDGGDMPVAINDDDGNLVAFWIWHVDTANSDCNGSEGEQLTGWFVTDISESLPLSISAGGTAALFGEPIVRLVE